MGKMRLLLKPPLLRELVNSKLGGNLLSCVNPLRLEALQFNTMQNAKALCPYHSQLIFTRNSSFLNKMTGERLWDSVTGVSQAGKKKGRAKRAKKVYDLNKGQVIGRGDQNIVWPGLNSPILKSNSLVKRTQLPPDPEYKEYLVKRREEMQKKVRRTIPPLIRGYTGTKLPGTSVGQPDKIGDYEFEGFDARVLEFKVTTNMTGTLGRKRTLSALVAVGNGNGIAGFGLGKAQKGQTAVRKAMNRAAQHLMYIPRFEDHTVYHNMFSQFHHSRIHIHRKEKGHGLVCHRLINTLCKLIGIKDIYCKVDGSTTNKMTITRGFFQALTQQETHQDLADRLNLHVVQLRPELGNRPIVVASPQDGEVKSENPNRHNKHLGDEYNRMYFGGKVEYLAKKLPRHHNLPSSRRQRYKYHKDRNQRHAQLLRKAGFW